MQLRNMGSKSLTICIVLVFRRVLLIPLADSM